MKFQLGPLRFSTEAEPAQNPAIVWDLPSDTANNDEDVSEGEVIVDEPAPGRFLDVASDAALADIRVGGPRGGTGTRWLPGIGNTTEEYNPDLKGLAGIQTYDRMRADGTVAATLRALILPLVEGEWKIEPPDTPTPDEVEQAQFVQDNLFSDIGWEQKLGEILSMYRQGHSVLEVVLKRSDDGKVRWDSWQFRPQRTIHQWKVENGNLLGIVQRLWTGLAYEDKEILAPNLLVFSLDREGDNFMGISLLRAAYKHWYMKEQAYKFDLIAGERSSMGVPWAKYPTGALEADVAKGALVLSGIHSHQRQYAMFPNTWDWGLMGVTGNLHDNMPTIEHHDKLIPRSVIASFLTLDVGDAQSHSKDLSSLYLMILHAIGKYVARVINQDAVKSLIDLNWSNVERYPTLTIGTLDKRSLADALAGIAGAVKEGALTADVELENALRAALGLPMMEPDAYDEAHQPLDLGVADTGNNPLDASGPGAAGPPPQSGGPPASALNAQRREMTRLELLADLGVIEETLNTARDQLIVDAQRTIRVSSALAAQKVRAAILRGDHIDPEKVAISRTELAAVVKGVMREQFEAGRRSVTLEARRQGAQIPDEALGDLWDESLAAITAFITAHAISLAGVIASRMKATLAVFTARQVGDSNYDGAEIEDGLYATAVLDLKRNAGSIIHDAFSTGRAYQAKLIGAKQAQYSALLDTATCSPCFSRDGQFFTPGTQSYAENTPPLHSCDGRDNCRCMWVYEFVNETGAS